MPTENDSPVLEYELCAKDGAEWKPIGKMEELPAIVSLEEDIFIPLPEFPPEEFTCELKVKPLQGEFSKKTIRWFRKNVGIDLLYLTFPKKKNRRKKRLWRNAKKVFRAF